MKIGQSKWLTERTLYLGKDILPGGSTHPSGTARFCADPKTLALNLDLPTHAVDNLYLEDARFLPSIGAVTPTLTIVAHALRVADLQAARL